MGLETGTYINDLIATNPVATDKKFQGDDHFRLIKSVLQNNFPHADVPFYIPHYTTLNVDTTLVAGTHGGNIIGIDTSAGPRTITLPAFPPAPWEVTIIKATGDANPVFVVPPSGTINFAAKTRLGVPWRTGRFISTGGGYFRTMSSGEPFPGTVEWQANGVQIGYVLCNGGSLLRADYPELFLYLGTTFGAVDGTHFSLPNIIDRFPVGAGFSYATGASGGEISHTLSLAEIPSHSHAGTTDPQSAGTPSAATNNFGGSNHGIAGNASGASIDIPINPGGMTFNALPTHTHSFTTNSVGGGGSHENRPPYFALYPVLRAC